MTNLILTCSMEPQKVAPSIVTINNYNYETNYPKVVELIHNAFELVGNQKTMKYFIKSEDYGQRLIDVVETLEAIRCSQSSTISVGDESYTISDYKIPVKLISYVNAGIIYASSDAVGSRKPLFKANVCSGKLTPLQFNKFFDDFNINQDLKLNVSDNFTRSTVVLGDVQYTEDEQGMMLRRCEGGLDLETCYLIGLRIDGLADYLTKYAKPNTDGMTKWLFD